MSIIKRKGFSFIELLICIAVFMAAAGGMSIVLNVDSDGEAARRDMARLEHWLNAEMLRADKWRSGFYLSVQIPASAKYGHYMTLKWLDESLSDLKTEYFYADAKVRWRLQGTKRDFTYNWRTHTISPAFVITALLPSGKSSGESLTVSLRSQITRRSGGKIM